MPVKHIASECIMKREVEKVSNNRHYDKYLRNKQSTAFYHSGEWISLRQVVISRYKGLDIYAYYIDNKIVYAEMVHHIIELEEDWNRRLDITNLIPLSNQNHNTISAMYLKDKRKAQGRLFELMNRWNREIRGQVSV